MKKIVLFFVVITLASSFFSCRKKEKTEQDTRTSLLIRAPWLGDYYREFANGQIDCEESLAGEILTFREDGTFSVRGGSEDADGQWRFIGEDSLEFHVAGDDPIRVHLDTLSDKVLKMSIQEVDAGVLYRAEIRYYRD